MAIETAVFSIGLLLITAKILGEITDRIGITPVVGQVLAGIVIGPLFGLLNLGPIDDIMVDLGIIFILFLAGLSIKFEDIRDNVYTASSVAVSAGLVSFVFAFIASYFIFHSVVVSIAFGIILISTANSVLFSILGKLGELKTQMGKMVVSITAADDIVAILALSFFTFFIVNGSIVIGDLFRLFLIAIGFYLVVLTAGSRIINKIIDYSSNLMDEQILLSVPLAIVFILAFLSDGSGLGIATGAFLAGMTMAKSRFVETIIEPKTKIISDGFVIPLFYAIIGSSIILQNIDVFLIIVLTTAAVLGKYIGSVMLSPFVGFKRSEDKKFIGLSMIPRGDYNIAVAHIALTLGVFAGYESAYTSAIFTIILTIIITPILLKVFLK